MSKVLLDSDVLIDLLRGRPATREFLLAATRESVPCCSAISVAEVHVGMRPDESDATSALLDGLVVLPVTRAVAELAGTFKRRDRRRTLELADCLIAATAALEGATLATGNLRDYPMPEITLLNARRAR
jgi:predicted nucleic acid-binding protein